MQTLSYITSFNDRRYLYPAKDGNYSLYPYDVRGFYHLSGNIVVWTNEESGKEIEVGELSENSKQLCANS